MYKPCLLCIIALTILLVPITLSSPVLAAQPPSQTEGARDKEAPRTDFEREKFEFEKANEDRKARYEIIKAVITGASLLIPLLLGIYTVRSQIRSAYELKSIEAENDFALKAAEIVMNANNPYGVRQKAEVLREIFKNRLPKDFVSSFEPKEFFHVGPSVESKMVLLKLIEANLEKEQEIVRLWRRMFPGDSLEELFPGDYPKPAGEADKPS